MLKGVDLSKWQAVGIDINDYDFVICKATEGVGYTDPSCDQHYQNAKKAGKLLGVYHFARPGYNDPIAEADWFVHEIQGYIGEAVLVLDWEVEATWNVGWAKQWLDRVYEKTGVKPMVYMSGAVVNSNDWSSVVAGDYGLWIAYWPNNYQYSWDWPTSPDEMTYGIGAWPFWAIWQFSSRNGQLDCDVANMDKDAWMKYAAKNGEPAPVPTPEPAPAPEPKPEPKPTYTTYTVQKGDNLSKIAAQFGTTWQKIYNDNKEVIGGDPNMIYAGQVLKIYTNGSAPTPKPATIGVGSKVTLKEWVDYYGTPLYKTRDFYYVSELNGDRAVLRADSMTGPVYCAANVNNLRSV